MVTFPCNLLFSIDVFFDLENKFSCFTIQGLFISTIQKSASLPTDKLPLLIFKIFAGLEVNAAIIFSSFTDPLWYNSNDKDNNVSIPVAPVAAWANVNLFCSSSSGLWSETITSIKSLFIPLIKASLSSSVLNGGDNFKKVLKSPISFSFSDKLFIETPHVNSKSSFLFFYYIQWFLRWNLWYMVSTIEFF